jgi:hypothetical protein
MFQAGSAPPRDGRPEWMPHWVPEPVASLPPPILVLAGGVLVVVLIIFWVSGHQPTSQAEVCAAYTRVYDEMNDPANDIYANALFDAVGDLASVASRYNGGDVDLRADAAALKSIAESTSTFDSSIISASSTIAVLCGRD